MIADVVEDCIVAAVQVSVTLMWRMALTTRASVAASSSSAAPSRVRARATPSSSLAAQISPSRRFPNANHRTDTYGGTAPNRSRFVIEVAQAVAEEIGADRVGIRLSPAMPLGGLDEGDTETVRLQYRHLVGELAKLRLAFLHVHHVGDDELLRSMRDAWPTAVLVVRYGRSREQIADDIDAGLADIAPLGRFALANPDVVERLRADAPLNELDPATIYSGGAAGYTDYPVLTPV